VAACRRLRQPRARAPPPPRGATRAPRLLDARPSESAWNPLLFPSLGRQRHDGAFPDAEPRRDVDGATIAASALSSTALINIVAPITRDAGVPAEYSHPHVLRHTFATLFLQRRAQDANARSRSCNDLLGHASIETARGYVHDGRDELARSMRSRDGSVLDVAAAARRRRSPRRAAGPALRQRNSCALGIARPSSR
jgi:integrase